MGDRTQSQKCDRAVLLARFFERVIGLTRALIPSWDGQGWVCRLRY
jgi:hypothetical protein